MGIKNPCVMFKIQQKIKKKRIPYIAMQGKCIIATAFTDIITVTIKCYV